MNVISISKLCLYNTETSEHHCILETVLECLYTFIRCIVCSFLFRVRSYVKCRIIFNSHRVAFLLSNLP